MNLNLSETGECKQKETKGQWKESHWVNILNILNGYTLM